jgi:hypothetical protein
MKQGKIMSISTEVIEPLRKLVEDNESVKEYFEFVLDTRIHNRSISKVGRTTNQLQKYYTGENIRRSTVVGIFKNLHDIGCGRYVQGADARFKWDGKMLEIALLACNQEISELDEDENNYELNNFIETYTHCYRLRKNFELELDLPCDLNADETRRIGSFVQAFAFGSSSDEDRIYELPLRPDLCVDVELPLNLTNSEADRIENYLWTLPLENDDLVDDW